MFMNYKVICTYTKVKPKERTMPTLPQGRYGTMTPDVKQRKRIRRTCEPILIRILGVDETNARRNIFKRNSLFIVGNKLNVRYEQFERGPNGIQRSGEREQRKREFQRTDAMEQRGLYQLWSLLLSRITRVIEQFIAAVIISKLADKITHTVKHHRST